jgi:putative OPT family oligopeptide transporter
VAIESQPATRGWSSTAPPEEFRPYIAPEETLAEFSLRAILFGAIFGVLFGAVTVYVGLRAGLTVSASIPIAVLSITILRAFGKATILENNIVQTIGSAGESVAAGVIFTLPALIFLGFEMQYWRVFALAFIGGCLGVLFMIPLRRQLIVKEHGNLLYPEGTACADVLVAGDRGGSFAGRVFWGLGIGGVYTFLMNTVGMWRKNPEYQPTDWFPGASFRASITSEYLGVGYVIGPRVAGTIFAGGVFSWLVMMPAIKFFGSLGGEMVLYPSTVPIPQMTPDQLWESYIRPMGAGAVATAGLITLMKTMPTILSALTAGLKDFRAERAGNAASGSRVDRDLPTTTVVIGSLVIVAMMWALLTFQPIPGAQTSALANIVAAVFVVIFGFLFVTVSSRICGLIGTSANPVSGMTIATLMATCAMFLVMNWTASAYAALALTIGGVVCIAAANAGATSQDLKTGYLVGATPRYQQIGLILGVMASVVVIGLTVGLMNRGLQKFEAHRMAVDIQNLPEGVAIEKEQFEYEGKTYVLLNSFGSPTVTQGKYLYDPQSGQVEVMYKPGIGSEEAAAPQAQLMATVIRGILNQRLPWRLVLLGVFFVIAIELLGIRSLSFAVGSYLSIGTTMAIFVGGVVRWLAERGQKSAGGHAESEVSPGSLYASGLIAAGGVIGLLGIVLALLQDPKIGWIPKGALSVSKEFLGGLPTSSLAGVVMYALLAATLFFFARKKLE